MAAGTRLLARKRAKARPANPRPIIAQVEGSGIVEKPVTRPRSLVRNGNGLARKSPAENAARGAGQLKPRAPRVRGRLDKVDQQVAVGRILGERGREREFEDAVLAGRKLSAINRRTVRTDVRRKVGAKSIDGG